MKYFIILFLCLMPIMAIGQGSQQDTLWATAADSVLDAWYRPGSVWDLSGTELDFGYHGDIRITGLISLPLFIANASIIDTFYWSGRSSDGLFNDSAHVTIWAEAVDSAVVFADDSSAFKSRFANVGNDSSIWRGIEHYEFGDWYTTPNCIEVLQEVVNRAGWKSGNRVCIFFIAPDDATDDAARKWRPTEWDNGADSPWYRVVWSAAPADGEIPCRRRREERRR